MGFFSWIAQDSGISIANVHSGQDRPPVYMMDDNGNVWEENDYQGYGVFGGKDFFELLAEMNGRKDRLQGILLFHGIPGIKHIHTHEIKLGQGIHFFNWAEDKIVNNQSANDLVELGDWRSFTLRERRIQYPNLVHNKDWEWTNEKPKDCPYQGYFY